MSRQLVTTPRISLIHRRHRRVPMPRYFWLVFVPFAPMLGLAAVIALSLERLCGLWADLWTESWMAFRAWRELGALDRFLTAHAGRTLNRFAANGWAWDDDATRFVLSWKPSKVRAERSTLELTAQAPMPLMTIELHSEDGPVLLSDEADRVRLEEWAAESGERIVKHIHALTGAVPYLTSELRVAKVRVPMTVPLKPLIGALELLLTAVPPARP